MKLLSLFLLPSVCVLCLGCSDNSTTQSHSPDTTVSKDGKQEELPGRSAVAQPSSPRAAQPETAEEPTVSSDENWVSLFNGRDLTNWTPMHIIGKWEAHRPSTEADEWVARDGILLCNTSANGWLKSDRQYADFDLELEFKLPPLGNSDVFVRSPGEGRLVKTGMGIQIIEESTWGSLLNPVQRTGAIWGLVGPNQSVQKPVGEWNLMRIRCAGAEVQVSLNGTQILDAVIDEGTRPRSGFIGLSNWHGEANGTEFRNIRIRELAP